MTKCYNYLIKMNEVHASVTVLFFQLFCMLQDFCNKQLEKIAWKENWWRVPNPWMIIGVAMGEKAGHEKGS